MGELCPWCGVTMQGDGKDPAYCSGRFACSQRKAFEDGQEAGYQACLDHAAGFVDALVEWTRTYGAALKPRGADTYGEGMRDAKEQVRRILARAAKGGA